MAKPIKKKLTKMVAGETKKVDKVKKITSSEAYHIEKKAKEAKRYGSFSAGPSKKDKKAAGKDRLTKMRNLTLEMRSRRKARSTMPTFGRK